MNDKIKNEIIVKEYSLEHKTSIINLLGHLLKELNETERMELFEWRYERNPYQKKPIIFLAFSGDLLVGFRAYLIQYFSVSDKIVTVISPADTIIHPEYRRRGLISMLNKHSLDVIYSEYPKDSILLNTTTSKHAMPTYIKFDWYPCSNRNKVYGYRFSVINIIRYLLKSSNKRDVINRTSFSDANFRYEVSNEIDTIKILRFIQSCRDKTKFTNIRDEAFFNWRYSYESDKYFFCTCYINESIVGYTIIKKLSNKQFSIEEYLATETEILKLMLRAIQKKMKIPIVRSIIFSNEDRQSMKYCGFFVEPKIYLKIFKKKRFPVLVRPTKPNLSDNDFLIEGIDMRNIENWQLYQSDRH